MKSCSPINLNSITLFWSWILDIIFFLVELIFYPPEQGWKSEILSFINFDQIFKFMSYIIPFECHHFLCMEAFRSLGSFVTFSFAWKLSVRGLHILCAHHNEKLFLQTFLESFKQETTQLLMLYEEKMNLQMSERWQVAMVIYLNSGKTV